jgi:hypothetical protein
MIADKQANAVSNGAVELLIRRLPFGKVTVVANL